MSLAGRKFFRSETVTVEIQDYFKMFSNFSDLSYIFILCGPESASAVDIDATLLYLHMFWNFAALVNKREHLHWEGLGGFVFLSTNGVVRLVFYGYIDSEEGCLPVFLLYPDF